MECIRVTTSFNCGFWYIRLARGLIKCQFRKYIVCCVKLHSKWSKKCPGALRSATAPLIFGALIMETCIILVDLFAMLL